ncbi:MAG: helix-turn-helix transcriptional regulator [bacterium]
MQIKSIGDRIREYRKAKGITVWYLAKIINISQGSLSGIETNKTKPSADTLQSLYLHTDISFHWLMTGEGPMFREGATSPTLAIEDIPREQLKGWIDDFWEHANQEGRTWLIYEVKRHFPEFIEYLKKIEAGQAKDEDTHMGKIA